MTHKHIYNEQSAYKLTYKGKTESVYMCKESGCFKNKRVVSTEKPKEPSLAVIVSEVSR